MRKARMLCGSALLALVLGWAHSASAAIDLEWRPAGQSVLVGDVVNIGLYAVSDSSGNQSMAAMDVIVNWDTSFLSLIGVLDNGPYGWIASGFPNDGALDGMNDTFADGDAYYSAYAALGSPAFATPAGLLVTTFQFSALAETLGTPVDIAESFGTFSATQVFDGTVPGLDVHGTLGSATVTITPEPTSLVLMLVAAGAVGLRRRMR